MVQWLNRLARRFAYGNRRGATTLVFGVTSTALVGTIGLAVQVGGWYGDQTRMQNAADAAATAGAVSIAAAAEPESGNGAGYSTTAKFVAGLNGFHDGLDGVTVAVNSPPQHGNYTADGPTSATPAVEVVLSRRETVTVLASYTPVVTVRAVALYQPVTPPYCILALGGNYGNSNNGTITLSGTSKLLSNGCSIGDNSTASSGAINTSGSTDIDTTDNGALSVSQEAAVTARGPINNCGTCTIVARQKPNQSAPAADPLAAQIAGLTLPPASAFTCSNPAAINSSAVGINYQNYTPPLYQPGAATLNSGLNVGNCFQGTTVDGVMTLTVNQANTYIFTGGITVTASGSLNMTTTGPVTFFINGGLTISGSSPVNLAPGTYFLNGGDLNVGASGSVTCSACNAATGVGINFVLMNTTPNAAAGNVLVSGASPAIFTAQTVNPSYPALDGIALYQQPAPTAALAANQTINISGSGTMPLAGAVYAPGSYLNISGASIASATCSLLVTNSIQISGSSTGTTGNLTGCPSSLDQQTASSNGVTIVE